MSEGGLMCGQHSLRLNRVLIHQVLEQELPMFDFRAFFPALTDGIFEENRSWLEPYFLNPTTGKIVLRIQSYVLQTPHHNILIDTCVGNHKPRPRRLFWHLLNSPDYESNFASIGLSPADIDFVMCTHLHVDHVGWNTRLENGRWVPTFPNARYVFGKTEFDYWTGVHAKTPVPAIEDSVMPIVEAKRFEVVGDDHQIGD